MNLTTGELNAEPLPAGAIGLTSAADSVAVANAYSPLLSSFLPPNALDGGPLCVNAVRKVVR